MVLSLILLAGAALSAMVLVLAWRHSKQLAELQENAKEVFLRPEFNSFSRLVQARQKAVDYARSMVGTPYDPLMGRHGDPFGRIGFVVCIDVPIRSYLNAGVSLPALLKQSAREHPELFKIGPNNSPSNRFFYRRVRNYFPLFQRHPALTVSDSPQVGDWAFYGRTHIALVVEAMGDSRFSVVEASPMKRRVSVSDGQYMERTWGPPSFFGRIRGPSDRSH